MFYNVSYRYLIYQQMQSESVIKLLAYMHLLFEFSYAEREYIVVYPFD